ncbi:MAG: bifunctional demethylmenaquinone methyltransferase/2-methoxy-6-polyprenyl-1,4-benzoquinol methylase UbiE [Acidobacteriaceae bacterium]|nr:bifunctional demethylmenaquinone methyltransferase/2-methoxy-6-polyprenyl-1,4-benzoquinol methylase UbiE [Acidobacteriaceae bacterium]
MGEHEAARWVQTMFAEVAPKYDFLNHLLSFNIDRGWRKALMRRLRPVLERPDGRVLDLCCGTGDVLIELQSVSRTAVMGADFCHPMLVAAKRKIQQKGFEPWLFEADALRLPFPDESLDAISIAFGFRNLANYEAGLHELYRVLRGRGVLALLEFSHPRGAFMKTAYGFYAGVVLPAIGTIVSGSREAYTYLPDSIRKFPQAAELRDMMTEAGFADTSYELLTGGIAALHVGTKASH